MPVNYEEVAKRYQPRGVTIRYRANRWLWPAYAVQWADGSREVYVPEPTTRAKLYINLHEFAHVILGHVKPDDASPTWKMEYEAERWAIATMRREGIPVPRRLHREAQRYVRDEIDRYEKRRARLKRKVLPPVPAHVRRFAPEKCRRWKKLNHKEFE